MLSYKTIESHTLELLRGLMSEPLFACLRLVGGTALALQYGHRTSVDLDFSITEDGITMASARDIAAMKINAIEGRGTKKDFIDIYFLLQRYDLKEILSFYQKKYPENSIFRALMSLSYFDDAEAQLMPKMFSSVEWENMKNYILNQVELYSKSR